MRSSYLALLLSVALPILSFCAVLNVPADQPTIQSAIDAAYDADTVLVAPGTYFENLDFKGKTICLTSSNGAHETHLMPATPDSLHIVLVSGEGPGTEISGFTISGSSAEGALYFEGDANARIHDNIFHSFAGGSSVVRVKDATVAVDHNLFFDNLGACISQFGWGFVSVLNNTMDDNGLGMWVLIGEANNNTITNSSGTGIEGFDVVDYNIVWNNNPDFSIYGERGCNNISADPMYADPDNGDYSLLPGSPCIDLGDPDPQYNDPDGSTCDIGAFPYAMTVYPVATAVDFVPETWDNWVSSLTPDICWRYLDTATTIQLQYQIQIGSDDDWAAAEFWDSGPVPTSDTCVVYGGAPLQDHNWYYLRIRVHNGAQWGEWRERPFRTRLSTTIDVPSVQPTIASALDIAVTGDTILLDSGSYSGQGFSNLILEDLLVINIVSHTSPNNTVIDLQAGDFISVGYIGELYLRGLRLEHGNRAVYRGVHANVSVSNCTFYQNVYAISEDYGYGSISVDSCQFTDNSYAIKFSEIESYWNISRSLFVGNYIGVQCASNGIVLRENIFAYNQIATEILWFNFTAENNVVWKNGSGFYAWEPWTVTNRTATIRCNDVFDNLIDYRDCPDQTGINGNISQEPYFCDTTFSTLSVASISPLLPEHNGCGVNIGNVSIACYCGDINASGQRDISDLTFLVSYMFDGGPAPAPLWAGDVDGSGGTDISDVTYYVDYLFGSGPAPEC